jgi:6-phosphofructo-2-kinase
MIVNGVDPAILIVQEEDGKTQRGKEKATKGGEQHPSRTESMDQSADFFSPSNEKAAALRDEVAMETLQELLDFLLVEKGSVGILDATNSTIERRQHLFNAIKATEPKLGILFVESVCEDEKVCLDQNFTFS